MKPLKRLEVQKMNLLVWDKYHTNRELDIVLSYLKSIGKDNLFSEFIEHPKFSKTNR